MVHVCSYFNTMPLEDQPVNMLYPQTQIQSRMPVPYKSHPAQTEYHTAGAGSRLSTVQPRDWFSVGQEWVPDLKRSHLSLWWGDNVCNPKLRFGSSNSESVKWEHFLGRNKWGLDGKSSFKWSESFPSEQILHLTESSISWSWIKCILTCTVPLTLSKR